MGPGGLELGAAESGHPAQCRRKGAEGDHPGQSDVQIQAQSLSCSVQGALKLYNWCVRINGLREEEEGGREQWRWGKGGRNLLLPSHLSSLGTETLPSPKTYTVQESATLPPREGRHSVIHLWAGTEWRRLGPVPLSKAQSKGVSHGAVALGPVATQVFFQVSWVGSGTDWSCG